MKEKNYLMLGMVALVISLFVMSFISAEMLISGAGVEYDSEIIDVFDDKFLSQELMLDEDNNYTTLKFIEGQPWLKVIIRFKDNSGINVTGSKEERRELSKQKDEWFELIMEDVLDTLLESDIKNVDKLLRGVGGHISKQGFEKLIKDERVRKIIWPKKGAVGLNNLVTKYFVGIIVFILIILSLLILKKRFKKKLRIKEVQL
jgi:hypothetical protein